MNQEIINSVINDIKSHLDNEQLLSLKKSLKSALTDDVASDMDSYV